MSSWRPSQFSSAFIDFISRSLVAPEGRRTSTISTPWSSAGRKEVGSWRYMKAIAATISAYSSIMRPPRRTSVPVSAVRPRVPRSKPRLKPPKKRPSRPRCGA